MRSDQDRIGSLDPQFSRYTRDEAEQREDIEEIQFPLESEGVHLPRVWLWLPGNIFICFMVVPGCEQIYVRITPVFTNFVINVNV